MSDSESITEAVEVLQQLGLKEYEARCFVGLSRMETGTAKRLSELTEVPRTRVYDAIRVLESRGLVEIQHSSPQKYRAVPLAEAVETLRDQYEDRIDRLTDALEDIDVVEEESEDPVQKVWAMTGRQAIENRANDLLGGADDEVMLVVGEERVVTDSLLESLQGVEDADLIVGALTESLEDRIRSAVPDATTFVSGLDWLHETGVDDSEREPAIGRLMLVDRSTILVSSIVPESGDERAVFGEGFGNGVVVIARRLMAQGLVPERDTR